MNIKEILQQRIDELASETRTLVEEREHLNTRAKEINSRLTHIVGAMAELQKLLREHEDDTDSTPSTPAIDDSPSK